MSQFFEAKYPISEPPRGEVPVFLDSEVERATKLNERKNAVQIQVMDRLGYILDTQESLDKSALSENLHTVSDWVEDNMSELFQKCWEFPGIQKMIEEERDAEVVEEILLFFSGSQRQSRESRFIKKALWSRVEAKLKGFLHIDDQNIIPFPAEQEKWHKVFSEYIDSPEFKILLKKGYLEPQLADMVARFVFQKLKENELHEKESID